MAPSTVTAENVDALKTPVATPQPAPAPPSPPPAVDAGAPCSDAFEPGQLARLSCDGGRILVARAIVVHPRRSLPPPKVREVLAAVAELMRAHPELLMLRVEVFGSGPAKDAEAERRALADTQARADAVFRYLWRREKISAERLEPVGRGNVASPTGNAVVLRVVQRR